MNHELTRRQVLEDLPAYVLGALEPEQMLAVDRYLQEKAEPDLLARWQELEEATTLLAVTADPVQLPSSIKEGLMARVQADLQKNTVKDQAVSKSTRSVSANQHKSTPKSWLAALNEWFSTLFRPVAWATVGGLAVAVLAFGYISPLQSQLNEAQRQTQSWQSELEQANEQIALLEDEVQELETGNQFLQQTNRALEQQIQQNENLLTVLATAEDQVALSGTDAAPASSGTLFFASNNNNEGVLLLDGLAPLSEDETYQLWLIPAEGDPLSVGLIDIADEATTSQPIELPPNVHTYAAVGLSQEPAGGSPSPTLVVMVGAQE